MAEVAEQFDWYNLYVLSYILEKVTSDAMVFRYYSFNRANFQCFYLA